MLETGSMSKYDHWELTEGGLNDDGEEIYKCPHCSAESFPEEDWNVIPDPGKCNRECPSWNSNCLPGRLTSAYKRNLDRIFPDAPGAVLQKVRQCRYDMKTRPLN